MLTDQLSTYLIPTVLDVPDVIEPIIVEVPEARGPWWNARPGTAALPHLAPAIHEATDIWMDEIPVTPESM